MSPRPRLRVFFGRDQNHRFFAPVSLGERSAAERCPRYASLQAGRVAPWASGRSELDMYRVLAWGGARSTRYPDIWALDSPELTFHCHLKSDRPETELLELWSGSDRSPTDLHSRFARSNQPRQPPRQPRQPSPQRPVLGLLPSLPGWLVIILIGMAVVKATSQPM